MAQHDYNIADQDGASFLADLNNLILAIGTVNSGATAPADTFAYMLWADTTSGKLKQRNAANDAWIEKGDLAAVDWGFLRKSNPTVTGLLNLASSTDVASASTVDLTAATGNTVRITGTTAITAFTMNAGQQMELIAVGALPLTFNATTMNVNGGVSYTCAAGDRLSVTKDGAGVIRVNVTKQDGTAVVSGGQMFASEAEYQTGTDTTKALNSAVARAQNIVRSSPVATTSGTSIDVTGIPSWAKRITILFSGVSTNGSSPPQVQIGDAGGIETTSYLNGNSIILATVNTTNFTSGFGIGVAVGNWGAARVFYGEMTLIKISDTKIICKGVFGGSDAAYAIVTAGEKTLSDVFDRFRLTTANGTDTFDAGSISYMWE